MSVWGMDNVALTQTPHCRASASSPWDAGCRLLDACNSRPGGDAHEHQGGPPSHSGHHCHAAGDPRSNPQSDPAALPHRHPNAHGDADAISDPTDEHADPIAHAHPAPCHADSHNSAESVHHAHACDPSAGAHRTAAHAHHIALSLPAIRPCPARPITCLPWLPPGACLYCRPCRGRRGRSPRWRAPGLL